MAEKTTTRRLFIRQSSFALSAIAIPLPFTAFFKNNDMVSNPNFEVIIIGGSYAGLSAAMALGRSLRKVLVIDSGKPCNAPTPFSHNFLTRDGEPPAAIATLAREQVAQYPTIQFYNGLAVSGIKTDDGFDIKTQSGEIFRGRKVIFATGIKDELQGIPGLAQCWGISVIHCPYCHGYEYRGKKTAILANGDAATHYAKLVSNLTKELMIFTNGKADFSGEQMEKLQKHNINIIETGVDSILHHNGHIENVTFKDGSKVILDAMYAKVPFTQHSDIPASFGCKVNEQGFIETNAFHETTVPGLFACGDNTSMMRSVANAVATGNFTGAFVNAQLAEEHF